MKIKRVSDNDDGPLVRGNVLGVDVTFLVDTGANVMILRPDVLERIPKQGRPYVEPVLTTMLLADGSPLPFIGRGRFAFRLGDEEVMHDMWVAEIELDEILGMDILKEHDCRLNLGQGCFKLSLNESMAECVGGGQVKVCPGCRTGDNCHSTKE